eukprot:4211375-Pleurochrysis_carterae.AAC.1
MQATLAVRRLALFPSRSPARLALSPSRSLAPCAVPLLQPGALRCPPLAAQRLALSRLSPPGA